MPRLLVLAALIATAVAPLAQWPFPGVGDAPDPPPPTGSDMVRLPGSPVVFHHADFQGMARAIDWFPDAHLPDGRGRPENARLQGLPADYIVEQVKAFASGARRAASPDYAPAHYMTLVAHAVSPADLEAAAHYFSRFEPVSQTRVVEAATIPAATAWRYVYRFDPSRREALGRRIVEGPVDPERFELRDPKTPYIAYVPLGAVARGRATAERGASGGPACVSCHGPPFAGIAGASPTVLARQLMGFRDKTRNDPGAAPMQAVAARLTDAQIIDVAAFVGSRRPWTRAELKTSMGNAR
jgi:cytochrome c553